LRIIGFGFLLLIILCVLGGGSHTEDNTKTIYVKDFSVSKDRSLKYFEIKGSIVFLKKPYNYETFDATFYFNDGSSYNMKNLFTCNNAIQDQAQLVSGSTMLDTAIQNKEISDIKSIDINHDSKVVYTWKP
jgi:hypothetical protein